jgi:hypothetical protein
VYIYLPWSISRQQTSLPNTSGPPEERRSRAIKKGTLLQWAPTKKKEKNFFEGKNKNQ